MEGLKFIQYSINILEVESNVAIFDMEFTGLRKNTTPISLGIVSEDGKKFYAEFTDYDENQCDEWIKKNVIENLRLAGMGVGVSDTDQTPPTRIAMGDRKYIHQELREWLQQFDTIQFVSDVCHYDFVLLIDLLTNGGTAIDLPDNISAVCHDLNMDIARHFHVSDREAFDMSREQIMNDLCGSEDIVTGDKHNSLYDAEVIRAIYKEIVR